MICQVFITVSIVFGEIKMKYFSIQMIWPPSQGRAGGQVSDKKAWVWTIKLFSIKIFLLFCLKLDQLYGQLLLTFSITLIEIRRPHWIEL